MLSGETTGRPGHWWTADRESYDVCDDIQPVVTAVMNALTTLAVYMDTATALNQLSAANTRVYYERYYLSDASELALGDRATAVVVLRLSPWRSSSGWNSAEFVIDFD